MIRYLLATMFIFSFVSTTITARTEPYEVRETVLQKVEQQYGFYARKRVEAMNALFIHIDNYSDKQKLQEINDFFNRSAFVSDQNNWGVKDYWARPLEFLGRDRGDCEDFVIAKYFALKKAGLSSEKLYFTYVKSLTLGQAHMVLSYYQQPDALPLVLDNLNHKILTADLRKDLLYIYSFNSDALYLSKQKRLGRIAPSGIKKHKEWEKFLGSIDELPL
ncbi:MAG: transglutaminase-like cysteine peptidase [Campylobacterota bacterium]|nr:transglutaminase-like cysteine peptidase [Campylobacterota bacterium]